MMRLAYPSRAGRWRCVAILAGLLAAPMAQAEPRCDMAAIAHCANASQLLRAPGFEEALGRVLDGRQVTWLGRQRSVGDVVREVLGGAPDDAAQVAHGLLRFLAVRAGSATERGAIFVSGDGTIAAIGVLHFNCAKRCDKTYSLSILVNHDDARPVALVRAWGAEQMALNRERGFEEDLAVIARVEVLTRQD